MTRQPTWKWDPLEVGIVHQDPEPVKRKLGAHKGFREEPKLRTGKMKEWKTSRTNTRVQNKSQSPKKRKNFKSIKVLIDINFRR